VDKYSLMVIDKIGLDVEPITILDYTVPQLFSPKFLVKDQIPQSKRFWSVDLQIYIDSSGIPCVPKISIDSWYDAGEELNGIQRWQLEMIENDLHKIITLAIGSVIVWYVYRPDKPSKWVRRDRRNGFNFSDSERRQFELEIANRSHRRVHNDSHHQRVAQIYLDEVARAMAVNTRARPTLEVTEQMGTKRGTAELWIREARDTRFWASEARTRGLLDEVARGSVNPRKPIAKKSPTKKGVK
jgi:hypothetical protein